MAIISDDALETAVALWCSNGPHNLAEGLAFAKEHQVSWEKFLDVYGRYQDCVKNTSAQRNWGTYGSVK